ncbi:QueT transporter family protein [Candidatus Bathyarchaeota archaeon]|nr:QueT transporter family protein [Candidatus Bathyarchaeota archaeon]MBL7080782.1 QueT transporter family protein [Candidatus Bathyarchaeota archaeon]
MEINTKDVTLTAIFAALYAALGVAFAPIGFLALQFRIAGALRPAVAKKPILAVGYCIGVVITNLFSPFAGFLELVFMPLMSLVAGFAGYYAAKFFGKSYVVAGAVIAVIIPISVSWMLNQLLGLPFAVTLPGLLVSEQIVNALGSILFRAVDTRYRWYEG